LYACRRETPRFSRTIGSGKILDSFDSVEYFPENGLLVTVFRFVRIIPANPKKDAIVTNAAAAQKLLLVIIRRKSFVSPSHRANGNFSCLVDCTLMQVVRHN